MINEYDEAQAIRASDYFRKKLEEFRNSRLSQLEFGDVHSDLYADAALELRGVSNFVNELFRPIIEEEIKAEKAKLDKEKAEKKQNSLKRGYRNRRLKEKDE